MSLNVNTALYSLYGVDSGNVDKIASQILKQKPKTPTVKEIDYSKFNRQTLGIDLYSGRTNVDLQKQISLTQAGLYAKSVDVAQLNSSAAASLYSASTVQKNVEKTQSVNLNNDLITPKQIEKNETVIKASNITDKHSSSSNGFNPFSSGEEENKNTDN